MRIITRGELPEERVHRVTCSHCKTVFECKQGECTTYPDGRNGLDYSINCPVCTRSCYVRTGGYGSGYFDS